MCRVQPMADESPIAAKERDRLALLEEASRIVAAASVQGRELSGAEDAQVLSLMGRVRTIEEELHHYKRRHRVNQSSCHERCIGS